MLTTTHSHPTLWRTCRVLANDLRLQVLELLSRESSLSVSAIAKRLHLAMPFASQSLRALESRGLLVAHRQRRSVLYRLGPLTDSNGNPNLLACIRPLVRHGETGRQTIFKLATAFTHPTRVELYRLLKGRPRELLELPAALGVSLRAVFRHLRKLERRGFVRHEDGVLHLAEPDEAFGHAIAALAAENGH
jgi:DNA-binding transcriptional ArsR family regulator